ncbi:uncharacterized protein [Engystomops pustulosus]|uniref:uncharacterized protein n=1 Tax=Engystomops pustulosus TaxID=76066 RepID=UPI003AFA8F2B
MNVASNSATMKGSFKKCMQGRSASPRKAPKMTTKDTFTSTPTGLHVEREEMTSNKPLPTSTHIGEDNGNLKVYKIKVTVQDQLSVLQKVLKQLFPPPITTIGNSWKTQASWNTMQRPNQRPIINISNLKIHFLRKIFEIMTMAYPEIVQRSVQIYNERVQTPPTQIDSCVSTEPSMDNNRPILIPRLERDILVPNRYHSYYKKIASSTRFKRSKRPTRKETILPIGNFLHLGKKIILVLSPEVCIDKSPKPSKKNTTPNDKRQNHLLEPEIMEGTVVTRSTLEASDTKNKFEMTEDHENKVSPHVTGHSYSSPRQEGNVSSSLKDDHRKPTITVLDSYSHRNVSTILFNSNEPSKASTFRFCTMFRCLKRCLLKQWSRVVAREDPREGKLDERAFL